MPFILFFPLVCSFFAFLKTLISFYASIGSAQHSVLSLSLSLLDKR